VHDLVLVQGPPEVAGHDEPVFGDAALSLTEPSLVAGHGHVDVPMADPPRTGDDANRLIRSRIAVVEPASIVSAAQPPRVLVAVTVGDGAGPTTAYRCLARVAVAAPPGREFNVGT
jgi:hypothetical protein